MTFRPLALAALLALAAAGEAHAVTFTTNGPVAVTTGAPVSFTVSASQLYGAQLGTYDITANYSSSLLSFSSVAFSNALGDPALFEAITTSTPATGAVEFADVSLLPGSSLAGLQPAGGFALATLNFTALRSGSAAVSLSNVIAGDASGKALLVPEPASAALCLSLLGGAVLLRRRRG